MTIHLAHDPEEVLGLYPASDFEVSRGRDATTVAGRAAAWYFADETVGIPRAGVAVAGYDRATRPLDDVRRWGETSTAAERAQRPPLVWLAAPDRWRHCRLGADAQSLDGPLGPRRLRLVPKFELNRSYFDARSAAYFAGRDASVRGTTSADSFELRAIWPEEARLGPAPPGARAASTSTKPDALLRTLIENGPSNAPFSAETLWQRDGATDWQGRCVLAFILNGAQGDDDEAHAGHFAIATGRIAADGAIGDWLVNSFYPLDSVSEKSIIAAPVPLHNYQGDLNAGQSWYRPSWMLVVVLDGERAAMRVQSALGRVYRQFWRHQLAYYHPTENCTSISVDTLRILGLDVPRAGPTSRIGAWLVFPWLLMRERSLAKAKVSFDYLVAERTRLLPRVALQALFDALWAIAWRTAAGGGRLEREIAQEMSALAWLRLPQFPSSRAQGNAPVASIAEYRARVPKDPALRQVVPVPARPFPEELRDADLLPPRPHPSELAVRLWVAIPLAMLALFLVFGGGYH